MPTIRKRAAGQAKRVKESNKDTDIIISPVTVFVVALGVFLMMAAWDIWGPGVYL